MNPNVFDALTRRASFVTLGAAGLAALGAPLAAGAKKKHRKNKVKKEDANKLCKQQIGQCLEIFTPVCDDNPDCIASFEDCCALLGSCDFGGFFDCAVARM